VNDLINDPALARGRALYDLKAAVKAITRLSVPDDEVADLLGEVQAIRGRLIEWEKALLAESPTSVGKAYRITDKQRPAKFSFNLPYSVKTFAEGMGADRATVLGMMLVEGVIDVRNATALRGFAKKHNLALSEVPHELGTHPGDETQHIGRQQGDVYQKIEALPEPTTSEAGF
jgi:hypothetical protein